ncbi:MAG: hypothetical protein OXE78_05070, partial [Gammaproteobacteria bacterium]|nr:hypothetical protein [Gammaproteobacteria bacterium]
LILLPNVSNHNQLPLQTVRQGRARADHRARLYRGGEGHAWRAHKYPIREQGTNEEATGDPLQARALVRFFRLADFNAQFP